MKYHLIALFTVTVWGLTFVSTKVLLTDFSPLWVLFLRFIAGFAALWVLRPHVLRMKERRHEWLFVAAGFTGIAAYYLMENVALVFATAMSVGVIVAAAPLFTALLSALGGDRRALNPWFFAGFVVAMAGLATVSMANGGEAGADGAGANPLLGDFLALGAAFVWAVYSVLVRRISDLGYETIASTKRTFAWGLVFIAPVLLAFGGPFPGWGTALQWQSLLNLAFLGFVASAACFVTWGIAVKRLGPTASTTYIYLVPAITAAASVLILGEPLSAPIVAGLLLMVGGLVLSQKGTQFCA